MEEDVGGVDESDAEVLPHQVMRAVDDFRVRQILRGEGGRLRADFDLLSDHGGAQGSLVYGVGAAERPE